MNPLVWACVAAFVAGFVDAIAGGGGLIQLPALLLLMPGVPVPTVLGTNKSAAVWGTLAALWRYGRTVEVPWRSVGAAAAAAFVGSFGGAELATRLPTALLRPVVMVLLVGVAAWTWTRRDFGAVRVRPRGGAWLAIGIGGVIGVYDGFFGPGTGTFLIVLFVWALGLDFLGASASAKLVNVATNLAAILAFAAGDHIRWAWSLPMAAANVTGSLLGARLAIARGSPLVRRMFQLVIGLLLFKLGWDLTHPAT